MIAILAIFFAIELEVAGLERMVTWVVVSFVGFHVVTHTVLTVRDKLFIFVYTIQFNNFPGQDVLVRPHIQGVQQPRESGHDDL